GYELYAVDSDNTTGENLEFKVDYIPNPKSPVYYNKKEILIYNENKIWEFKDKVLARTSSDVIVTINGVKLSIEKYTFVSNINTLNIHTSLSNSDIIKVEYHVDKIEYIHNTIKNYKYSIVPIFKKEYSIGNHNKLRY
ncbi:hypothetical protein, partial [Romboutsia sp.]|uniref:hypothetical protein n=1 Tax=Romboutsia sp. TaxID=1965302 RepID=UPI003F344CD3